MMRRRPSPSVLFRCLLAAVLALAVAVTASEVRAENVGPWQQVRDEAGIRVQRRMVEGSNLHEFQGRGVIDAPLTTVLAVLHDVGSAPEWMHKCAAAHVVQHIDDRHEVVYNRTAAPWPVSDRDAVLSSEAVFDARTHEVRINFWSVTDPKEPPVRGVVRMPSLHGHWILSPVNGGRATQVEYQVHADPGGSLPGWIVNMASKEIPFQTIASLREQVKRRHYPEYEKWIMSTPEYQSVASTFVGPAAPPPPAAAAAAAASAPAP
jgi:uncharacterized membrane protein